MNPCEILGWITGYIVSRVPETYGDAHEHNLHEIVHNSNAFQLTGPYLELKVPLSDEDITDFLAKIHVESVAVLEEIMLRGVNDCAPPPLVNYRNDTIGWLMSEMHRELSILAIDVLVTEVQRNCIRAIQWMLSKINEDLLSRIRYHTH